MYTPPIVFDMVNVLLNKGEEITVDYAMRDGHHTGVVRSLSGPQFTLSGGPIFSITIMNVMENGHSFHSVPEHTMEAASLKQRNGVWHLSMKHVPPEEA